MFIFLPSIVTKYLTRKKTYSAVKKLEIQQQLALSFVLINFADFSSD